MCVLVNLIDNVFFCFWIIDLGFNYIFFFFYQKLIFVLVWWLTVIIKSGHHRLKLKKIKEKTKNVSIFYFSKKNILKRWRLFSQTTCFKVFGEDYFFKQLEFKVLSLITNCSIPIYHDLLLIYQWLNVVGWWNFNQSKIGIKVLDQVNDLNLLSLDLKDNYIIRLLKLI